MGGLVATESCNRLLCDLSNVEFSIAKGDNLSHVLTIFLNCVSQFPLTQFPYQLQHYYRIVIVSVNYYSHCSIPMGRFSSFYSSNTDHNVFEIS